jgi:hypothetical protein
MRKINISFGLIISSLMVSWGCSNVTPVPSSSPSSSAVSSATPVPGSSTTPTPGGTVTPVPTAIPVTNVEYIKTGYSFGLCRGYCQQYFTITADKVSYLAKSNDNDPDFPDITRNDTITKTDYDNLLKSLDLKKFNDLPDVIGCPDCADGGAEWIEIKNGNSVEKTTFGYNTDVPQIKNFLNNLRTFRDDHKNPGFINKKIAEFLKEEPKNPPVTITQYDYKGKKVYYISSYCCDFPSQLYDEEGNLICEPDGGITGRGDGKCTDFFTERKNELLIWKDTRK